MTKSENILTFETVNLHWYRKDAGSNNWQNNENNLFTKKTFLKKHPKTCSYKNKCIYQYIWFYKHNYELKTNDISKYNAKQLEQVTEQLN